MHTELPTRQMFQPEPMRQSARRRFIEGLIQSPIEHGVSFDVVRIWPLPVGSGVIVWADFRRGQRVMRSLDARARRMRRRLLQIRPECRNFGPTNKSRNGERIDKPINGPNVVAIDESRNR